MTEDDAPIAYIERTRAYYAALGYSAPYRWARFDDVRFTPLAKPLTDATIALVTTAAPFRPEFGDQGPGAPYNGAAKFFTVYSGPTDRMPDLRIAHVAYDRDHTSAEDPAAWFPLAALQEAAARGRIGRVAPRFHGLPTNRSQRATIQTDAPELLARCQADGIDAAILVPNCPVCHQSAALAARHLETGGIPTVVMGAARDIVEQVGVPRFWFSDVPLGNSAGRPHDPASQAETLEGVLHLLETASGPRTTIRSPLRWSADPSWKRDYGRTDHLAAADLAGLRSEFDAQKAAAPAA